MPKEVTYLRCSVKKGVHRNFANLGLQLYWKKNSNTGVFQWNLPNIYFEEHLRTTASACIFENKYQIQEMFKKFLILYFHFTRNFLRLLMNLMPYLTPIPSLQVTSSLCLPCCMLIWLVNSHFQFFLGLLWIHQ